MTRYNNTVAEASVDLCVNPAALALLTLTSLTSAHIPGEVVIAGQKLQPLNTAALTQDDTGAAMRPNCVIV